MKRATLTLLFLCASLLRAQEAPLPARPEQLPPKEPLNFTPPELVRQTLPNGIRLILLENHNLPLVSIRALVKVGGIYEPAEKVGLAELTGSTLATGGTTKHDADALAEALESIAAELDASIGLEEGSVSLNLLSKDLGIGLPLFAEVLTNPAFTEAKLEVERAKMIEGLRRQNEEPFQVARREFAKRLYGGASPWARTPSVKGVQGLTRADVQAFHAKYFKPNATIIAAAGDFDAKDLAGKIGELFKGWPRVEVDSPAVAPAPAASPAGVLLTDKGDLTQTSLLVGELSGRRFEGGTFNEDIYPMQVMNFILGGGGFNSTLTREIRSNRGLAYGAGSYFTFGTDRGVFAAYCQTGVKTTGQVVQIIRDSFKKAASDLPTPEELSMAKDSILNKFVFNYQNPAQIVNQAALYEFRGYPKDYLATYCANIQKVTAEDVRRVASKYIHADTQTVYVLGPAKDLQEPLKEFGKVEVQPLPEP